MVFSIDARIDVDNELLTKLIVYRRKNLKKIDLATDENDNNDYVDFNIKAQCTIQRFDSKYVSEGVLLEGDLVGWFRYKYEKDADGFLIFPTLIPRSKDLIKFAGQWFSIKQCTAATNEDAGIIGWDFTAGQIEDKQYELEENDRC
jgi:hypothetical protein